MPAAWHRDQIILYIQKEQKNNLFPRTGPQIMADPKKQGFAIFVFKYSFPS